MKILEKLKNKKIITIGVIIIILIGLIFIYYNFDFKKPGFKVNTILIKSVVKRGEEISTNLNILNLKKAKEFKIETKNLEFASLSEKHFYLDEDQGKNIEINFKPDYFLHEPGAYVGKIVISAGKKEKEIPVIIEIHSEGMFFAVNLQVAPEYKEVKPGNEVSVGIKILNLNDTNTHSLELTSLIRSLDDDLIVSDKENIAVGTEALITKTMVLPKDMEEGDYAFSAIISSKDGYGSLITSSSYLLNVRKKIVLRKTDSGSFTTLFSIIVLFFLFGIVILIVYIIKEREKLKNIVDIQTKEMQNISSGIKKKKTVSRVEVDKIGERIRKQVLLLEKAYSEGYITRDAFVKGKKRLKNFSGKMKKKYL